MPGRSSHQPLSRWGSIFRHLVLLIPGQPSSGGNSHSLFKAVVMISKVPFFLHDSSSSFFPPSLSFSLIPCSPHPHLPFLRSLPACQSLLVPGKAPSRYGRRGSAIGIGTIEEVAGFSLSLPRVHPHGCPFAFLPTLLHVRITCPLPCILLLLLFHGMPFLQFPVGLGGLVSHHVVSFPECSVAATHNA